MAKPIPRMAGVETLAALAERGEQYRYWYQDAKAALARIADDMGLPYRTVSAAFACASPRTQVSRHLPIAIGLLTGQYVPGTMRMHVQLFQSYRDCGIPRSSGHYCKVTRFTQALWGYHKAIPVDVWVCTALGIDDSALKRAKVIEHATNRIECVAKLLDWPNRETQAAIWGAIYSQTTGRRAPPAVNPSDIRQKKLWG